MNVIERERKMQIEAVEAAIQKTFRDWGMRAAWELTGPLAIAAVEAAGKARAAASALIDDDRGDICG